jgi:hypothetical protein
MGGFGFYGTMQRKISKTTTFDFDFTKFLKYCIISVLLFCAVNLAYAHPIKISNGKIALDKNTERLEISLNFFMDDFSHHLEQLYHIQTAFNKNADGETQNIAMDYIARHFKVYLNDTLVVLQWKNATVIEDNVIQVQLFADVSGQNSPGTLKILNTLLFDAFDDQSNILQIDQPGGEKSVALRFIPRDPVKTVNFGIKMKQPCKE